MRTWRDGREGYPLPWCDEFDVPYWVANIDLIRSREGWAEWQSRRSMNEIIPEIDLLISEIGR